MQRPDLNVGQTLMSQRQTLKFARKKHNVSKNSQEKHNISEIPARKYFSPQLTVKFASDHLIARVLVACRHRVHHEEVVLTIIIIFVILKGGQ